MVNDLVAILLCIVGWMWMIDYSRRPPKDWLGTMDDDG